MWPRKPTTARASSWHRLRAAVRSQIARACRPECVACGSYFAAMSRRGDKKRNWCVSADGGQGHAIEHTCARQRRSRTSERNAKSHRHEMNVTRNGVLIVHLIKNRYDDPKSCPRFTTTGALWDFCDGHRPSAYPFPSRASTSSRTKRLRIERRTDGWRMP